MTGRYGCRQWGYVQSCEALLLIIEKRADTVDILLWHRLLLKFVFKGINKRRIV